jgi:tetratricopeptide (TPR) repeat protein
MQLNFNLTYGNKRYILLLLFFFFCLFSYVQAQDWMTAGINYVINTDFEQAIKLYQDEIDTHPQDYRAHFYLAAALNSRMVHFENQEGQDQFEQAIDQTIDLIQQYLQAEMNPQDRDLGQCWFYLGSAYGYRAYNQGRNGKWLAALSNGMKAAGYLQKAVEEDSTLYDAYLGIGTYKYWRHSKLSFIYWLPFFPDEREEAIRMIKKTANSVCLSRDLAKHQLVFILLDYGRNEEAIDYARQLVEAYPRSQFMYFALAHAYYKSKMYAEAEKAYLSLIELIQNDPHKNYNHLLDCMYKLALIYKALNEDERCQQQCASILELYNTYPEKDKFDKIGQVRKLMR